MVVFAETKILGLTVLSNQFFKINNALVNKKIVNISNSDSKTKKLFNTL